MTEPAAPNPNQQLHDITRRMEEIRTDQNREAIDLIRVGLVDGRLDWDVVERLVADAEAVTIAGAVGAYEESERLRSGVEHEPIDDDRIQLLDHYNRGRAERFLPVGAALLSEEGKQRFDAHSASGMPANTVAAWLRGELRREGKGAQLDAAVRGMYPEIGGDSLTDRVSRFADVGRPLPQAGAETGDGAKEAPDTTPTLPLRNRPDITR